MEGNLETPSSESEFEIGRWHITEDNVRQYLAAVGDAQQEYFQLGLVPPLFLTAYALTGLLGKLALAPGAIHSLQEVDTLNPVEIGDQISGTARLERPRRRGNLEFTTVSYTLTSASGIQVQAGKSTVLAPAAGGA
ncbi:MAG: MaoC family dehydratase [Chloroflexi bacterium]|nr:MaoC family dehydratase [Chloroflexota bacterium]